MDRGYGVLTEEQMLAVSGYRRVGDHIVLAASEPKFPTARGALVLDICSTAIESVGVRKPRHPLSDVPSEAA